MSIDHHRPSPTLAAVRSVLLQRDAAFSTPRSDRDAKPLPAPKGDRTALWQDRLSRYVRGQD